MMISSKGARSPMDQTEFGLQVSEDRTFLFPGSCRVFWGREIWPLSLALPAPFEDLAPCGKKGRKKSSAKKEGRTIWFAPLFNSCPNRGPCLLRVRFCWSCRRGRSVCCGRCTSAWKRNDGGFNLPRLALLLNHGSRALLWSNHEVGQYAQNDERTSKRPSGFLQKIRSLS